MEGRNFRAGTGLVALRGEMEPRRVTLPAASAISGGPFDCLLNEGTLREKIENWRNWAGAAWGAANEPIAPLPARLAS